MSEVIELEVEGKHPLLSKTLWWNVLTVVAQSLDVITGAGIIPQPYGMIVTGLVNLVLRGTTTQPLAIGKEQPKVRAFLSEATERRFLKMPAGL